MSTKPGSKEEEEIRLCDWENVQTPYYTDSHKRFRKYVRDFVDKEILPNIDKWEKDCDVPKEFYKKCYNAGLYSTFYPKEVGGTPWENLSTHDAFLSIIFHEEISRAASGGLIGAAWIHYISIAPILIFGSSTLQSQILSVIQADKFASLCISEPTAGSDVRNIKTTAKREGDHYIVNGEKYWITGGMKADYFITAVRTGGEGINGISLLLIERDENVITTRLPLQGHDASATAYVVFRNCKVPVKNIIGKENEGFKPIMFNFNTERFGIICTAVGLSRVCIDEAAKYAKTRQTFGKPLIKHQVIRHKLAEMSRLTLSSHTFLENVAYRLSLNPLNNFNDSRLIRDISLLKAHASKTLEYCAREASQIFGGRSYVRGGRAGKVERIYRDVRAFAIYGGSEEIMLDLAVRQAKL